MLEMENLHFDIQLLFPSDYDLTEIRLQQIDLGCLARHIQ